MRAATTNLVIQGNPLKIKPDPKESQLPNKKKSGHCLSMVIVIIS